MRLPTLLKSGGHQIKVDYSRETDGLGEFDCNTNLIKIDKRLTQSQKEAALFHEIFHAINSTFNLDTTSHLLLDSLSEQLYQVFKDNGLLK